MQDERAATGPESGPIRRAVVAGVFYPAAPAALRAALDECVGGDAGAGAGAVGAIVPHAAYLYSGRVAGAVFRAVAVPARVVILAPNHTGMGLGVAALWPGPAFETPLGRVPVDHEFGEALSATCPLARPEPAAHFREHAVEVILPFLQAYGSGTRVLPIVVGFADWDRADALGRALAEVARRLDPGCWFVASSDMSHYESVEVARRKDRLALDAVEQVDGEGLLRVTAKEGVSMCGRVPAAAMLVAARALGARSASVVAYGHSGEASGDVDSVVGYAGVVVR